MAKKPNEKYELIKVGRLPVHRSDKTRRFYQVKALRDIPEHNVTTGDLGGYVTHRKTLSPEGSCWIGGEAQVIGNAVSVTGDAYVGDRAVVQAFPTQTRCYSNIKITGQARVFEDATVISRYTWNYAPAKCTIKDKSKVYGNAHLNTVVTVDGASKIYGSARLIRSYCIKNCEIYDYAETEERSYLQNSSIYGNAFIDKEASVVASVIYGEAVVSKDYPLDNGTVMNGTEILKGGYTKTEIPIYSEIPSVTTLLPSPVKVIYSGQATAITAGNTVPNVMLETYKQLCGMINSYETDIVKILQYPVMTDKTNPYTLDMILALNSAKRYAAHPESNVFKDAVALLEKAFVMAESNARKIASSHLSETEKKKTSKAQDLFRVASNEASSEQEKKAAFLQGFKQLEGILDVPESAVDAFRIKIGLPELEM